MTKEEIKLKLAVEMARARGKASVEWHKNNVLTAETLPKFQAFMKKINKEFKTKNQEKSSL